MVDVFDAGTGVFKFQFQAFETGFSGGVRVAVGRSNGQDFIAAAAGPGGFLVRTFLVGPGSATAVGQFSPFGTFQGGINVALGDLQGDGGLEVVAGPDAAPNCNPFINVWNLGGSTNLSGNVFAFEQGFTGGVRVAVGDTDGNGQNEIITSAGPGGLPFVQIINGQIFRKGLRFQVFDTGFQGGVTVAAGLADSSGIQRIVIGADAGDGHPGDEPVYRIFDGQGNALSGFNFAFEQSYHGGINVGTSLDGRGKVWILTTPVRPHNPEIHIFSAGFKLLENLAITDARTNQPDANFANGASAGG
jgi:serralysin